MIRARVCFAAMGIVCDAETNAVSIFNLFEGINAAVIPFVLTPVSCFALWLRDNGDPQRVEGAFSVDLDDERLTELPMHIDFATPEIKGTRSVVNMAGLVVPRAGVLHFRFTLRDGPTAEYSVEVYAHPPVVAQVQ